MNRMTRGIVAFTLTSLFCLGPGPRPAFAGSVDSRQGVEEQTEKFGKLKQVVNQDVQNGLTSVGQAIQTLDKGDSERALKELKEALGDFDVALGADPSLKLVPVSSVIRINNLNADPKAIRKQIDNTQNLLASGQVQAARELLSTLRSDITETVTYLPMATYPAAIRKAVKELVDGDIPAAKATLAGARDTLVIGDVRVVPIPLLNAQALIAQASKMDKTKKSEVLALLQGANEQIEVSKLLGYNIKDQDYQMVSDSIKRVKKEVEGPNAVEKLYSGLTSSLAGWIDTIGKQFKGTPAAGPKV